MKVARTYLTTWFSIDLVSSIPFDYLGYAAIGQGKNTALSFSTENSLSEIWFLTITKLLGLLRLLRIFKLQRFAKTWESVSLSARVLAEANHVL